MTTRTRKRFGQHWLRSETVLNNIIAAAQIQPEDRILEIGAGTGILTRKLLKASQAVLTVEIDLDLCRKLVKTLGKEDNFLLLQGDFLDMDINALTKDFLKFQNPNKVVANIPYNVTGEIIESLLGRISQPNPQPYQLIVLLVQKEVAQRMCAEPNSRQFGALSVRVQYLAQCEWICEVPSTAFHPAPKVDSAVVSLHPQTFPLEVKNPKHLDTIVRVGFAQKRKMLRNNLKGMIESDRTTQLLKQLEINPQSRAENLGVADWIKLSNLLATNP